jgi:hypothetical protein
MSNTSTKYRISGANVFPFIHQEGSVVDTVPAGYYKVAFNPMIGFYLEKETDQVELPATIFGSAEARSERIMKAYSNSPQALGVGLFGKKGAGKSLLSAVLAHQTIAQGKPVIDVSDSFCTDPKYLEFLNSIQECTIIFDEFLKHISKLKGSDDEGDSRHNRLAIAADRQDEMLNFFQGTNNRKRLIVLIDNSHYMLSDFLTDRPGRMRYMYIYDGVEQQVVQQLCKAHGLTEDQEASCIVYSKRYGVSFDVMNEIIKEWAEYPDESLEEITAILNVPTLRPEVKTMVRVDQLIPNTEDGGKPYQLVNELGSMINNIVSITVKYPNPLIGKEYKDEDEDAFYEDGAEEHMSWTAYKALEDKDAPYVTRTLMFNNNDLIAIRGNKHAYKNSDDVQVVIEIVETSVTNQTTKWNSTL